MKLSDDLKKEYRKKMIKPFLAKGKNLALYVTRLAEFVSKELEKVVGENLDYNLITGEQSPAIASIYSSGPSTGLSLNQRMEQNLSYQMSLSCRLDDYIDIEECDDPESAFIGAYSAMLHEVGHHLDSNGMRGQFNFMREMKNEDCSANLITEVTCDKIASVLGQQFDRSKKSSERQRLYWISKLGLFSSFLIRMDLDMYDDEQTLHALLRFKTDFTRAKKMKVLRDDLRYEVAIALTLIDDLIKGLVKKGNGELKWATVKNIEETINKVQRNISIAIINHDNQSFNDES